MVIRKVNSGVLLILIRKCCMLILFFMIDRNIVGGMFRV